MDTPTPGRSPAPTPATHPTRRRVLAVATAALAPGPRPPATPAPAPAPAPAPTAPPGPSAAPAALQPYASYWFPHSLPPGDPAPGVVWRSLSSWSPETDPDLPYNASTVPLADRFTPVPAHPWARAGRARVSALVSFAGTAGNPSQGSPTADHYAPTHWAYLDELVFWGGSAGEGLVLAPNAPVTDAAHRNGVPVLGTVFLPPVAYGGDLRWTRDLVRTDADGGFPAAAQLARVAEAHGFDGWFVNAETDGGDVELATRMRAFLRALRTLGAARGLRVTWYDAMDATGRVAWQGALNDRNQEFFEDRRGPVSDTMYVDFGWTREKLAASGALADRLGRSRYELWAGVDVEARGWDTRPDWDALLPRTGDHVVSLGLYRPEWTRNHLTDRSPRAFHAADDRFWTGRSLDPARPDPEDPWRAPATAVADRSTVAEVPFATSFNTGHGLAWYEDGVVRSTAPWNHLGLQDRLPGRRWVVVTTGARPVVALDFDDAWRGGSSLLVEGELTAPTAVGLHAVRLPVRRGTVLDLTHKASAVVRVEVGVAVSEPAGPGAPVPYTWLPAGSPTRSGRTGAGWRTDTVRLGALAGRTVYGVAVRLTAPAAGTGPTASVRWRLGALAVRDRGDAARPAAPTGLRVDAAARSHAGADGPYPPGSGPAGPDAGAGGAGAAALRLSWRPSPYPVRHYELYRRLPDGDRCFLGGTCGAAFYVPALERHPGERAARLELRAVDELYRCSAPARAAFPW
ncbi:endo-beta-N-acetylglucosaminidase [Streptomyces sp. NPDC093225]|uniref:endo-beta-N-acetylglucosaminidase n=1 Tax=Streptomyces sp. NPDC093225 TaxID=3366034 RepID=UPI0038140B7E